MQNAKALAAIFVALLMGTIAATLVSGCRPAARRGGVGNTGSTTTDSGPRITIPKDEVKPMPDPKKKDPFRIDTDGIVRKVEFFADGRKIGEQNLVFIPSRDPGQTQTFGFVWRFATPGPHVLTVRATDDDDALAWSAPVEIRVTIPDLLPIVRAALSA